MPQTKTKKQQQNTFQNYCNWSVEKKINLIHNYILGKSPEREKRNLRHANIG